MITFTFFLKNLELSLKRCNFVKKKQMKTFFGIILFLTSIFSLHAQSDFDRWREQQNREFQEHVEQTKREFEDFRSRTNAEFAEFLRRSWEEFSVHQGVPAPKTPEPESAPVADPDKKTTSEPLPFEKIIIQPQPAPRVQPLPKTDPQLPPPTPQPQPQPPALPAFDFLFYNTQCKLPVSNAMRFVLRDVSEESVSQAWKFMSENVLYDALIDECIELRDKLNLSDWGYLKMLQAMSEKFFGNKSNETVLMQMFILTQSGYKLRIARTGNRLALLIPFREIIYEHPFLNIDGVRFFIVDTDLRGQSLYISNHEFPKEQIFSWQTQLPNLTEKLNAPKSFASTRYPELNVRVQTNQNLIDFYNDYPRSSSWDLYILAGLSHSVKQALYPAIQRAIAGKSKQQAAQVLLNFLHTGFEYKMCSEQFGYERPFFADENFFFPYNNCKHRAGSSVAALSGAFISRRNRALGNSGTFYRKC